MGEKLYGFSHYRCILLPQHDHDNTVHIPGGDSHPPVLPRSEKKSGAKLGQEGMYFYTCIRSYVILVMKLRSNLLQWESCFVRRRKPAFIKLGLRFPTMLHPIISVPDVWNFLRGYGLVMEGNVVGYSFRHHHYENRTQFTRIAHVFSDLQFVISYKSFS